MLQPLIRHPGCRALPIRVEAGAARTAGGTLALRFVLGGELAALLLPPLRSSARRDGLWRHSCFEAFLREQGAEGYDEINLSPSTEWAAYRFAGYRRGMADAGLPPPRIEILSAPDRLELRAEVALAARGRCRLGLAAVVEHVDGGKSYWALAHPPGPPDFHAAACFALELAPAGGR